MIGVLTPKEQLNMEVEHNTFLGPYFTNLLEFILFL